MIDSPEKPRRGRPPSIAARGKALAAARDILRTEGPGRLTIEKVARASGVGKPTIYRSWANAQDLALAALIEDAPEPDAAPDLFPDRALATQLTRICAAFSTPGGRRIASALAAADPDSERTRAFRDRVIMESREAGRAILSRAVASGALPPPDDMEALLDMIYGPIVFRLLAGHAPLDAALVRAIVARVFPPA